MKQSFTVAAELLDEMRNISKAWYTHEDFASLSRGQISKEKLAKEKERDELM